MARFDAAGRRVELQIAVIALSVTASSPDAPANQIVLALELAEELPGPLVADLLFETRGSAVSVIGQTGARTGHIEVFDRLLVIILVEIAFGHHEQGIGITEHLVVVAVGRSLHVRTPELRPAPRTGVRAVERLVPVAPGHVVFGANVLAHFGLEPLTEIDVRTHGGPYGRRSPSSGISTPS